MLPVICLSLFAACEEPDEDDFDVIINRSPAKDAPIDGAPVKESPAEETFDDSQYTWVPSTITDSGTKGSFNYPYGITIEDDRNFCVIDTGNKRVLKLSRQLIEAGGAGDAGNSEASEVTNVQE
ncbi:MAG: hypothetical protein LBH18_04950 [Spirochaetaceae bacterium]|jgi:hypothetical protein|nr:hypothetical protein [Spirochaetaceae bacterium]